MIEESFTWQQYKERYCRTEPVETNEWFDEDNEAEEFANELAEETLKIFTDALNRRPREEAGI